MLSNDGPPLPAAIMLAEAADSIRERFPGASRPSAALCAP